MLKLHCVGKYWLTQRSVFCMNLEGNQKRCNKFDLISMTMHEWYKYPFNALAAMSYISPTNTPMSFSNLKKKMSKNILLMHWLQFVTPTPHFISTAPPPLKNVYTVLCICVFVSDSIHVHVSMIWKSVTCSLYLPRCGFNDNDACQSWYLRIMSKLTAPKQLNEFFAFTFHAWCQDHNSGSQDPENCYQLCQKGKVQFCTYWDRYLIVRVSASVKIKIKRIFV